MFQAQEKSILKIFISNFDQILLFKCNNFHFSRRFCKFDRMRIPNVGERVPYVIIYGEPGKPLIQSVRSPDEVLKGKWLDTEGCQKASMRPNAAYYITKVVVPALSRCLSLVGADVLSWYVFLL